MNNNISLNYKVKARKTVALSDVLSAFIAGAFLGAEYAAYVVAYALDRVYQGAKAISHSPLAVAVGRFAYACGICTVVIAFFGVIGGMEAGTIDLITGCIVCGIMCLCGILAANARK